MLDFPTDEGVAKDKDFTQTGNQTWDPLSKAHTLSTKLSLRRFVFFEL